MAGLSGIVKKISDLVTGTPADDDCFVFGKSDLKKITLAKLKDALGITSLNSAFMKSNMDILWINQEGTYTFPLPIGKMAVVITYHGIYPHYSGSSGIIANQLGGDTDNENVITSVNNSQHTVSVYNKGSGATQAVILMPRLS